MIQTWENFYLFVLYSTQGWRVSSIIFLVLIIIFFLSMNDCDSQPQSLGIWGSSLHRIGIACNYDGISVIWDLKRLCFLIRDFRIRIDTFSIPADKILKTSFFSNSIGIVMVFVHVLNRLSHILQKHRKITFLNCIPVNLKIWMITILICGIYDTST